MSRRVVIIGAGIGGLGAACLLAKHGYEVTVLEKNAQVGGRVGVFEAQGFRFDTGPSWYLMPEVFVHFFAELGEAIGDHLQLERLQPSYRVFFKDRDQTVDIYGDLTRDRQTFESMEPGAGRLLEKYLQRSRLVYETAVKHVLYKNFDSPRDFLSPALAREAHRLSLFSTLHQYVQGYFKDQRLQQIMEYPAVFLGSSPYHAPALYNLMNHVDFGQGAFYPRGGMYAVIQALEKIARQHGVKIELQAPVSKIVVENGKARGVVAGGKTHETDLVVSNADPYFAETELLMPELRDYSEKYWQQRKWSPSALLMYLGVDRQYDSLRHHNLVFSQNWRQNFTELERSDQWPTDPSFYVSAPSKTDPTVAPQGMENLFVLVPVAAGLTYSTRQLEKFAQQILQTMEMELQLPDLRQHVVYKRLFSNQEFASQFNAFHGSALGLAHTLKQSAAWRPRNQSRKVRGLYYVGANVHPGIGLPTSLISAQLLIKRLTKSP